MRAQSDLTVFRCDCISSYCLVTRTALFISVVLVLYAVYLTYKSETVRTTIRTMSSLHLTAANSLANLGSSVKRKTMERINNNNNREDGQCLVDDEI